MPNKFIKKHIKEYEDTKDMIVSTSEVGAMAAYVSKQAQEYYDQRQARQARAQR